MVLFISSLFLLVPTLFLTNWQERLEERRFFSEFERNIQLIQQQAIVRNQSTSLEILESQNKITFSSELRIEDEYLGLRVPDAFMLSERTTKKITFSGGSGHYSGMGRIEFLRKNSSGLIRYQFQIGSGRYTKTSE